MGTCIVCLGILYFSVFQGLVYDWINLPDFSHGFLIPFISLYLVWQRLDDLEVIMEEGKDHGELSFSEVQVKLLGEKHAIAFGRSRLKFGDGTELNDFFSTVYVKTPFGWKAILSHD